MTETAKKLTANDLFVGAKVTFILPSGKTGEGTIAKAAAPFSTLEDGRKVRPGSCKLVGH